MTKEELENTLTDKGVAFDKTATKAQLEQLLASSETSNGEVWVIAKEKPVREHNFRLPVVTTPTALSSVAIAKVTANTVNKGRNIAILSLGADRFRMWNDEFQGALEMEQERLDAAGVGIKIYKEVGDNIELDKSLEFTSDGRKLTVNA
jgi:hypothetical protein